MSEIRILIAEDHETVREGLRLIIDTQDDMQVCGEAGIDIVRYAILQGWMQDT